MTMLGWKLATASSSAEYTYVAADMELESALRRQNNSSNTDSRVLWFKRKVCIQFFTIIFSPCVNVIAIPILLWIRLWGRMLIQKTEQRI